RDAAPASIYGARASAGVILIQTKKVQAGHTKVEYNGNISLSKVLEKPTLTNAEQYGMATFRGYAYAEQVYGIPRTLPATYACTRDRVDPGRPVLESLRPAEWLNADQTVRGSDTDWLGEILRPAMMTSHQLAISTGTERSRSLFSLGYYDTEGTQIPTFFRQ